MREDVFRNLIAVKDKLGELLEPEAKRYLERLIKFGRRNGRNSDFNYFFITLCCCVTEVAFGLLTLQMTKAITVLQMIQSWYTGHWWVGCYIWYSEEGSGWAAVSPSPLLSVANVTAHPSTASVSITVLLYDGPLLCGFNVAIRGLDFCFTNAPVFHIYVPGLTSGNSRKLVGSGKTERHEWQ